MPLTINARAYTIADTSQKGAVGYDDPSSTSVAPSRFRLAKTDPKPTNTFKGVARGEAKFTKSVDVGAGVMAPAIMLCDRSIPVGTSQAAVDLLVADFRSFVASTAFADWVNSGRIYHA